jgi:hypothetical protein
MDRQGPRGCFLFFNLKCQIRVADNFSPSFRLLGGFSRAKLMTRFITRKPRVAYGATDMQALLIVHLAHVRQTLRVFHTPLI